MPSIDIVLSFSHFFPQATVQIPINNLVTRKEYIAIFVNEATIMIHSENFSIFVFIFFIFFF